MLSLPELVLRGVYIGRGRNFHLGVWDGRGFLGARYKFGYRVDTEYHYDSDPHYGTFSPFMKVADLPERIELVAGYSVTGAEFMLMNPDARRLDPNVTYYTDNMALLEYCLEANKLYRPELDELAERLQAEAAAAYAKNKKDGLYEELPPA